MTGKELNLSVTKTGADTADAISIFNTACTRLRFPSVWHELAGSMSAKFDVETHNGQRPLETDDLIKIDIPGPGNTAGEGRDWVKVEDIRSNIAATDESFGIRLRAATDPHKPGEEAAHFFTASATSTFIITRTNLLVGADYYGRNEQANKDTDNIADNIRNTLVAAGAVAGFSRLQWTALIKGLLK